MTKPEEKTVMVVDDEPDVVFYLKSVLEDEGFNVLTAGNGEEALEKLKKNKVDFISLDLVMPRKSGIKFLYEMRHNKEWSRIPVVIVTGHARDEMGKSDFEEIFSGKTITGPQVYLEKPVKPKDYVDMVKRQLGIEVDEAGETGDPRKLKSDLKHLLDEADSDTLKKIKQMLGK